MSLYSLPYVAPIVAPSFPSYVHMSAPSSVSSGTYQASVQALVPLPVPSVTSDLTTGHHVDIISQVIQSMEVQAPPVAPAPAQSPPPVNQFPALTEAKQFPKWILKV
jgi:hypothetical protein